MIPRTKSFPNRCRTVFPGSYRWYLLHISLIHIFQISHVCYLFPVVLFKTSEKSHYTEIVMNMPWHSMKGLLNHHFSWLKHVKTTMNQPWNHHWTQITGGFYNIFGGCIKKTFYHLVNYIDPENSHCWVETNLPIPTTARVVMLIYWRVICIFYRTYEKMGYHFLLLGIFFGTEWISIFLKNT